MNGPSLDRADGRATTGAQLFQSGAKVGWGIEGAIILRGCGACGRDNRSRWGARAPGRRSWMMWRRMMPRAALLFMSLFPAEAERHQNVTKKDTSISPFC